MLGKIRKSFVYFQSLHVIHIIYGENIVFINFLSLKNELSTPCNLGQVRDRHVNPHIFGKSMKRTFCFSVAQNLKIQISNGQNFKFLTVKNSNSCNTGGKILKHVHIPPQGPRTPYQVLPKLEIIHIMVLGALSNRITYFYHYKLSQSIKNYEKSI